MTEPFANLDFDREKRCGFPEFIFGAGKTPEQIADIMKQLHKAGKQSPSSAGKSPKRKFMKMQKQH